MAAPKHIKEKAMALQRALDRVDKLATELEEWYGKKAGDENLGCDFFHDYGLDSPYEFMLDEVLAELDNIAG